MKFFQLVIFRVTAFSILFLALGLRATGRAAMVFATYLMPMTVVWYYQHGVSLWGSVAFVVVGWSAVWVLIESAPAALARYLIDRILRRALLGLFRRLDEVNPQFIQRVSLLGWLMPLGAPFLVYALWFTHGHGLAILWLGLSVAVLITDLLGCNPTASRSFR